MMLATALVKEGLKMISILFMSLTLILHREVLPEAMKNVKTGVKSLASTSMLQVFFFKIH